MNKITLCLVSCVLCLAQLTNTAAAATYYLDAVNGNDANPGDSAQPWKTLARAYTWYIGSGSKVQEGDTVLFKNGSYGTFREHTDDGEARLLYRNNWVTYKAATGHHPVLTGITVQNLDKWPPLENGRSYLVFDGFTINEGASFFYTSYVKVLNCTIHGPQASGISGYYEPYFINNSVCLCAEASNYVTFQGNNISQGFRGIKASGGNFLIKNNTVHYVAEDGIEISGATPNCTVEDNLVYDHRRFTTAMELGGTKNGTFTVGEIVYISDIPTVTGIYAGLTSTGNLYVYPTSQTTFLSYKTAGKTVVGADSKSTLALNYVDPPHCDSLQADTATAENLIIINNIFNTYLAGGVGTQAGQAMKFNFYTSASATVKIENNFSGGSSYGLGFGNGTKINNNTFIGEWKFRTLYHSSSLISEMCNNIIEVLQVVNDYPADSNVVITAHKNNIYKAYYSGFSYLTQDGTEGVLTYDTYLAALFVNKDVNDYNLASGSLAINFGNQSYAPVSDILGRTRSFPPDAGCYEYVGSATSPSPGNSPPHADAGSDQSSTGQVTLDGFRSSDPNGSIVSYIWSEGGSQIATGVNPTITLSPGRHTITLKVTDNDGGIDTDTVTILIELEAGLRKYFKFDEGSGVFANDSTGIGNAGFLINGPAWTAQGEISFDGDNDTVEITTEDVNVNRGTIALWAYPNAFSKDKHSLFGHVLSQSNRIQLYCNAAGSLNVGLGSNAAASTNIQLNAHDWYHIVLVWDQGSYRVFVDGVTRVVGTYSGLSSLATYADIGNSGNRSDRTEGFDGIIDEVRLYNKPLSAAEIADIALVFLPIGDKSTSEGEELSFTVRTKSGLNTDILDSNIPSMPYFASNLFRWTPDYNDSGVYEVEFTAPHGSSTDFEKILSTDFEKITISVTNTSLPDTVPPSQWDNGVGDAYYQFGDKVHIWDLSGSYSLKAGEWQLDYVLKQDARGKITGTGTASNSAINSGASMPFTLKGGINAAGLVKLTLKGAFIKGRIKATVNSGSKALSGTLKMGKQSASFTAALPADMDGAAVLEIHCSSAGKRTLGTAKVTLSNGTSYNFLVKGKFKAKSDESSLTLKGTAKGTSLKLKVNGSDGTIKTLKGKMLGQKLKATNIAP